jgi:hypothetical protein
MLFGTLSSAPKVDFEPCRAAGGVDHRLQQVQHQEAVSAGFTTVGALRDASQAELRLAWVMAEHPRMNFGGLGMQWRRMAPAERHEEIKALRAGLRTNYERVETLSESVSVALEPRKTINERAGNCGLKHSAELDPRR